MQSIPAPKHRPWVEAAILFILPAIAFGPAVHGDFVLDDDLYVTNSDLVKLPDGLYRFWFTTQAVDYYPVANSSFWLEWRLWGADSTGRSDGCRQRVHGLHTAPGGRSVTPER